MRDFHAGELTGLKHALLFSKYLVRRAHRNIGERMLKISTLWKPHAISVLESIPDNSSPSKNPFPWTVTVITPEAIVKLQAVGVDRPPTTSIEAPRYTVTAKDVPKWILALTSTYRQVEGALLDETKKAIKETPSALDFFKAAMALNVMHGLLSSGFYDRLLDEKVVNLPVQPFGRFYSCGCGECHHPVPNLRSPPTPGHVEDSQREAIERKLMNSYYNSKTVIIL